MATKLTLSIDEKVIQHAKKYARSKDRSLSNIVEEYLKSLAKKRESDFGDNLDPLVKSLWGSVKIPIDSKSSKELLTDALVKKYIHD